MKKLLTVVLIFCASFCWAWGDFSISDILKWDLVRRQDVPSLMAVALAGKLGTNATPESIGAVPSTPAGIAAAGGALASYSVVSINGDYSVPTNDTGRLLVYTGTATSTFSLPSIDSDSIGVHFQFSKTGTGKLIIASATAHIADSGLNGTIYNDSINEVYATLHLIAVATDRWVVSGFFGTWTTTSN